jgi:hypothetical protein
VNAGDPCGSCFGNHQATKAYGYGGTKEKSGTGARLEPTVAWHARDR